MAKVYFHDLREKEVNLRAIDGLMSTLPHVGGMVAVKIHFGEHGNTRAVKPAFVKRIIDRLKEQNAYPFLTDTATLYTGRRTNALNHRETALEHGFSHVSMGCPVIIADGLKGEDYIKVSIDGEIFKRVKIASSIFHSDSLVSISHFKGHSLTGFGGCVKNLGMGCAPPAGKEEMHSVLHPEPSEGCTGRGDCLESCRFGALSIVDERLKLDLTRCTGCGGCIGSCPDSNLTLVGDLKEFQKRMAEYALGAVEGKMAIHLNFLMDITRLCDCVPYTQPLIAKDIGILASTDPIALDKASLDLFEEGMGASSERLSIPKYSSITARR